MSESTASRSLSVLHVGDIYLGSPFPVSRAEVSAKRRKETADTLARVFERIREENTDIVLLSGNLFDNEYVTYDQLTAYRAEFGRCPHTEFFIAPGQRDSAEESSIYEEFSFGKNVHVFSSSTAEVLRSDRFGVSVIGFAWTCSEMSETPMVQLPGVTPGDRVLVCGHASAKDGAVGVCVTEAQLCAAGAVYAGLSYGENYDGLHVINDRCHYAYSGPLESGSYADEGYGGVNKITVSPDDKIAFERVTLGTRRYIMAEMDVSSVSGPEEISRRVAEVISTRGYGGDTALCIVYTGHTAPGFVPPVLRDSEEYGVAELVTVDRSMPDRDAAEYTRDMSVRGELVRAMSPAISGNDEKAKEIASKALRISFTALDNGNISVI